MGNVYLHPTAEGKRPRKRPKVVTTGDLKRMCSLYRSGWNSAQIAELLNFDPSTITRRLAREGIKRRPRTEAMRIQKLPNAEIDKTAFLYTRCLMTQREVANFLGLSSSSSVQRRLLKAGVKLRSRSETGKLAYQKQRMRKPRKVA